MSVIKGICWCWQYGGVWWRRLLTISGGLSGCGLSGPPLWCLELKTVFFRALTLGDRFPAFECRFV